MHRFRGKWPSKERASNVYEIPDPRTRKRVPHESLPDTAAPNRDGARPLPHRAADKNLVPESPHEAQKGNTGHQRAERTGEAGASTEGGGSCGGRRRSASGSELADPVWSRWRPKLCLMYR